MILMTGGFCFNVKGLTQNYLRYPVSVQVSVQRETQLVFPAVTFCDMSPVRNSALQAVLAKGAIGYRLPMASESAVKSAVLLYKSLAISEGVRG